MEHKLSIQNKIRKFLRMKPVTQTLKYSDGLHPRARRNYDEDYKSWRAATTIFNDDFSPKSITYMNPNISMSNKTTSIVEYEKDHTIYTNRYPYNDYAIKTFVPTSGGKSYDLMCDGMGQPITGSRPAINYKSNHVYDNFVEGHKLGETCYSNNPSASMLAEIERQKAILKKARELIKNYDKEGLDKLVSEALIERDEISKKANESVDVSTKISQAREKVTSEKSKNTEIDKAQQSPEVNDTPNNTTSKPIENKVVKHLIDQNNNQK